MSLAATTLSTAIGTGETTIVVASATNITAPNFTAGTGITYLLVEQEMMLVLGVSGTFINVQRGILGTPTAPHGLTSPVISGLPTDFPSPNTNLGSGATLGGQNVGATGFAPAVKTFTAFKPESNLSPSAPVASAASITASGPLFHVTGTTAINIITPPVGMVEGYVTIIFDGVATWTSSNTTNGISASGTPTTAGSAVSFYLDQATARWYPSRLA